MSHQPPIAAQHHGRRRLGSVQRRVPTRPLDDGTTELVRVIQFVWTTGGRGIQPVLMVERELLN